MSIISKLEAAQRILREAIHLFFEQRDPIAIHTLAAASQQVLRDLAKKLLPGFVGVLHDHPGLRQDYREEWIRLLNEPRNFFKHAEKDSGGSIEFDGVLNELLLFDAVCILAQLSNSPHAESLIYAAWFELRYPTTAGTFPGNEALIYCRRGGIHWDAFPEFAKLCQTNAPS